MINFKGLPLYEAKININDDETGMFCISLVDLPATESNFVAFAEQKELLKYNVQNEEQHKVFGLVMAADCPLYRRDASGYEYYITYSKETIALMAEKYFKMGLQNEVDTDHNFVMEDGITLTQMFIKDTERGIIPNGYEDYKDGSLFAEFHIENEDIWSAIKDGTYKGFSLAGVFNVEEVNKKQENKIMTRINKIKGMLKAMLQVFGEISTDKGVLVYDGDEDIKVGDAVHGVDEEGNEINVEDGEYATEDKRIIVVVDGKVSEIKPVEEEKPTEEEEKPVEEEEKPIETEEEKPAEEEEKPAEEDEKDLKIKELENKIADLEKAIEEKDARIKELEDAPAAKNAEEEFAAIKDENTKASQYKKRGYRF